jgi:hypothetical protein
VNLPVGFSLPATLPTYTIGEALAHRICTTRFASTEPSFRATGQHRFDDPNSSYGTLYCARDFGTCFLETLLRGASRLVVRKADYRTRSLAILLLDARRLRLVDLFSTVGVASAGLDLSLLAGNNYRVTQAISALVYSHPQQPHGIVYRSRFDPDQPAVALFDRARRLVRLYPGSKAQRLTAVPELADGVRNRVPFVLI